MPEFLELLPPEQALQTLLDNLPVQIEPEEVQGEDALGRVTAEDVLAPHPLPSFARSTVDGYAVRAADTHGAGESLPAYLQIAGEVPMGAAPDFSIAASQCALIHTGGMLPGGADAVVMVEHTQSVREDEVEVLRAVAAGDNVVKVGEDVAEGEQVIPAGTRLRPAEIGGLMALGVNRVPVARRPKVGILSTGDEVVPPEAEIGPGQVRDVNSFTLGALVEQAGGAAVRYGIIPDREADLRSSTRRALAECDLVVITAGSSASARDLTSQVINELGPPGVLVHGVDVRPGKPTILAICRDAASGRARPVIGLPGNPVSALVIAGLFVVPVIGALMGLKARPRPSVPARLALNLASQAGREDWVPVQLLREAGGYRAEPIFGKSNLIFTLARADGLLRIPPDATGLDAGEVVEVFLF
jgi:molybdopterin molybdotransferase